MLGSTYATTLPTCETQHVPPHFARIAIDRVTLPAASKVTDTAGTTEPKGGSDANRSRGTTPRSPNLLRNQYHWRCARFTSRPVDATVPDMLGKDPAMTSPRTAADLAVIDEFMRDLATRALADAIRQQSGQLALSEQGCTQGTPAALTPPKVTGADYALYGPVSSPAAPGVVTVHPVAVEQTAGQLAWYRNPWRWAAIGAGAAVLGGLVWAVVYVVTAVSTAVVAHTSGIEGVAVLAVLLALACMLGGRGGGKRISGTFEGRVH